MSATLPQPLPPWAVAPLACGVMSLAFAIAYPLSRTEPAGEGVSWPAVFPSAAINYPPSEDVGGLIISIACVLMSYTFLIRHAENAARLGKDQHVVVNHGSLCVALVGMVLCPLGVVAYPWHLYPQTHFFWAYSLFYLGASYLVMQAWLDAAKPEAVPAWLRYSRLGLVIVGTVAMLSYIAAFGATGKRRGGSMVHSAEAATAGEACVELLCLLILLLFVSSFGVSQALGGMTLTVSATLDCGPPQGAADAQPSASTPLLGAKGGAAGYDAVA